MPDAGPNAHERWLEGCGLACDGILRSKLGTVSSDAAEKALKRLRRDNEGAIKEKKAAGLRKILPFPGKFVAFSAAVAAAITFLLVVRAFTLPMGKPVLVKSEGSGVLLERGGQRFPAVVGRAFEAGDLLRTSTNSLTVIGFGTEQTEIAVQPGTTLVFSSFRKGKQFTLSEGTIRAKVAEQRPLRPMIVETPQAEIRVLGTELEVIASTNATRLNVAHGIVRLTRRPDGVEIKVPTGSYTVSSSEYKHLAALPLTGHVDWEYWTNAPGDQMMDAVVDKRFPDHPTGTRQLRRLETTSDWADNYSTRIRGYIHPPKTGDYVFKISAADSASLWLSPSEDPEEKQHIANRLLGATVGDGRSAAYPLEAGKCYYFEVVHKAGVGHDYLKLEWQMPASGLEVLDEKYLSPFFMESNAP